jgi:hypothetical protein
MQQASLENIYSEIMLLSDSDRYKLYGLMKKDLYQDKEIVAYTTSGEPLTVEQYRRWVRVGIEQCEREQSVGLEELSNKLGYNYADL